MSDFFITPPESIMSNVLLAPPEILLNILSRLSVEEVLDCRRVCKTWKSLITIDDKYFRDLHLQRLLPQIGDGQYNSNLSYNNLSFIFVGLFRNLYTLEFDDQSYEKVTRINMRLPLDSWELIGSCNGLVCLAKKSQPFGIFNPVYVCNPITRECVSLIEKEDDGGKDFFEILSGFGYCGLTNEYKVVRIVYYGEDVIANGGEYVAGHVQVYTLGSGCGWRDKGETKLEFARGSRSVSVNGVCYWLDMTGTIVGFDLAKEEFQLISPPPGMDVFNVIQSSKLCTLGGCLCMFQQPVGYAGNPDIWVLKSVGKSEVKGQQVGEWVQEFKLPSILNWELYRNNTETAMPFALTKRGEILFKFYQSGKTIASYDPKIATPRNNWMLDKVLNRFEAIPHVNTFVSLKALGEEVTEQLAPIKALQWFR